MAKQKKEEPFDWTSLLFQGVVAARGLSSDDPKIQKACGKILNESAEQHRKLAQRSRRRALIKTRRG